MLEIDNNQVHNLFLVNYQCTFSIHLKPTIKGIISVII